MERVEKKYLTMNTKKVSLNLKKPNTKNCTRQKIVQITPQKIIYSRNKFKIADTIKKEIKKLYL